jgi:hypothetical protein
MREKSRYSPEPGRLIEPGEGGGFGEESPSGEGRIPFWEEKKEEREETAEKELD